MTETVLDLAAFDAAFRARVEEELANPERTDPPWKKRVTDMIAAGADPKRAHELVAPRGRHAHLPTDPPKLAPAGEALEHEVMEDTSAVAPDQLLAHAAHLAHHVVGRARARKATHLALAPARLEGGLLVVAATIRIVPA